RCPLAAVVLPVSTSSVGCAGPSAPCRPKMCLPATCRFGQVRYSPISLYLFLRETSILTSGASFYTCPRFNASSHGASIEEKTCCVPEKPRTCEACKGLFGSVFRAAANAATLCRTSHRLYLHAGNLIPADAQYVS